MRRPINATNFILILRDFARRFNFFSPPLKPLPRRKDGQRDPMLEGRFDVLPAHALEDDATKRHTGATRPKSTQRASNSAGAHESGSTGGFHDRDYRKTYLEQREQESAAKTAKTAQGASSAAVDMQKQQAENNLRYRAREIQNKIAWWEQQRGQGQYDDTAIANALDALRNELGTIPQHLQA